MSLPLLLASLGNPGPQYAHTRHSAGHQLLLALISHLSAPAPAQSPRHGRCLTSSIPNTVFALSPALMNASGPPVAAAHAATRARTPSTHLVVLHDELELPLGRFALRTGSGASARGHNGLRSLLAQPGYRDLRFSRVAVGVGPRPSSREPDVVARFVLGRMKSEERAAVEGLAGAVWEAVEGLRVREAEGGEKRVEAAKPKPKVKKVRPVAKEKVDAVDGTGGKASGDEGNEGEKEKRSSEETGRPGT